MGWTGIHLRADLPVCAVDSALHSRPEALDRVGRSALEADIFMRAVIGRHGSMPARVKSEAGAQFGGLDCAAGDDIGVNVRLWPDAPRRVWSAYLESLPFFPVDGLRQFAPLIP